MFDLYLYHLCLFQCFAFHCNVYSLFNQVPGEKYRPSVEVSKSSCRRIKSGIQRTYSPQYVYSFVEENEDEMKQEKKEPRLVVQMDTESSMLYQKTCLDHFYDIPVQVRIVTLFLFLCCKPLHNLANIVRNKYFDLFLRVEKCN